jgi:hypothetical protein
VTAAGDVLAVVFACLFVGGVIVLGVGVTRGAFRQGSYGMFTALILFDVAVLALLIWSIATHQTVTPVPPGPSGPSGGCVLNCKTLAP